MGTNEVSRRRDEMPAREEGEGKGKGKGGGDLALGTGTDQDQNQVYLDTLAYHQHYKKLVFSRGVNEL